jgi:predicted small metal-binding protein
MKDFHCRDAGVDCDYVARGQSNDEIVKQASEHSIKVHHEVLDEGMKKQVEGLIHDENSDAHQKSMQGSGISP